MCLQLNKKIAKDIWESRNIGELVHKICENCI